MLFRSLYCDGDEQQTTNLAAMDLPDGFVVEPAAPGLLAALLVKRGESTVGLPAATRWSSSACAWTRIMPLGLETH